MCSFSSASQRFFFNAETRAQIAYCVMVSCGRLSDFRAVVVLRYGLWLVVIGLSRRLCSALWSLVVDYRTFVQMTYCVRVSSWWFGDIGAVVALRYGLLWSIIGLSRSRRAALRSLFACFETLVQYGARARFDRA